MPTVADLISHLQETYAQEEVVYAALWTANDVIEIAIGKEYELATGEATEILDQFGVTEKYEYAGYDSLRDFVIGWCEGHCTEETPCPQ